MSSFCLLLLLLLSVYLSLRFVFRKEKLTLVSSPPMMMDGETKSDAKEKQNRFLFQYRKREPRQTITTRNEKGGMRSTETKQNSLSLSLSLSLSCACAHKKQTSKQTFSYQRVQMINEEEFRRESKFRFLH
jgi:hypothetical protein